MAAFEITITPPAKKVTRVEKPAKFVTPKLILEPFKPTPEVEFGSVTLNAKITKSLIIYNPGSTSISVQLRNIDPEDRITLSDSAFQLNAGEEKEIYVSWSPIQHGYLRKVIRVQDAFRKARSFDVVLIGTCVSNKANDKRKRLTDENNKRNKAQLSQKKLDSTVTLNHMQQKLNHTEIPLRRLTYAVEEKENLLPNDLCLNGSIFRTSSPKYQNTTNCSNDNLHSFDNIDAPTKYSNFESELRLNSDISNLHSSEGTNFCRRSTYGISVGESVKNPFSLSSVDELDSSFPHNNDFSDSLYKNLETPLSNDGNVTFEAKCTPEHNAFTPLKRLSGLLSPPTDYPELLQTPRESTNLNITPEVSYDWSSSSDKKTDVLLISPPTKTNKHNKKSPEFVMPRRHVSSAISDRKKHLKSHILPRRKTPPSVIKKNRAIPSVEKMKTQDPSALKQVLRSNIDDPFLRQSLYCDEHWIDRQEKNIIKWMNSLLTPPVELNEENDWTVDAAEVWLKSRYEDELRSVPSMDNIVTSIYHCPQRLDTLRKIASKFLTEEPVYSVFKQISIAVERKIIGIREDRDLHLDQGLKNKLIQLVSSYNPLWLQIALEAIYNQKITRQSKSDVGGLGWFIRKHLLSSSTTNKNAHPAVLQIKKPNYKDQVKKYILKKFLCLIYFLDQAKMKKLIRHNPCLFVLTSEYKSSRDLLLAFCGDLVVGRGDIIKHLKVMNYNLEYRQTCIDEHDFNIKTLHDLKDGVILTRLFEILFNERDLCSKLRVPIVDLTQKKYNVGVAMKVAMDRCTIEGNITPAEIVSGHREKILSFLWQIINNYLNPLHKKSAIKIQRWWRIKLFKLRLQQSKLHRKATIIQLAWRRYMARKKRHSIHSEITTQIQAANTIKKFLKRVVAQKKAKLILTVIREEVESSRRNQAVVLIQKWWRGKSQRKKFLQFKANVVRFQRLYRAYKLTRQERCNFLTLKKCTILIQRKFRANQAMLRDRRYFQSMRNSAIIVQRRFRSNKKALVEREKYLLVRKAAICIQRKFRAKNEAKKVRQSYHKLKTSVLLIQRKFRARQAMNKERTQYIKVKMAAICIQRRFRANRCMKLERKRYVELRKAVLIVQRKYRATRLMKREREQYLVLKNCCMNVQHRFRANQEMKLERNKYRELRKVTISLQRIFRAKQKMKADRDYYVRLKICTILMQRRFRAKQMMIRQKKCYEEFRQVVIGVQRRFRANCAMKQQRKEYSRLRNSVILVQRIFRANRDAKMNRKQYLELKKAVTIVQNRFRANKKMKENRNEYSNLRRNVIYVQRIFRANLAMKKERNFYLNLKNKVIVIQRIFRANRAMKLERNNYITLKKTVTLVQQRYRAIFTMRKEREKFLNLKYHVIRIQRLYRAKLLMQKERRKFLSLKIAVLTIQRRFKMKRSREQFLKLKHAAITLQRKYRALKETKKRRASLTRVLKAVKTIQSWYRCQRDRRDFLSKRKASLIIQSRYRAWRKMKSDRIDYLKLKYITCLIQNRYIVSQRIRCSLKKFSLENKTIELHRFSFQMKLKNSIDNLDSEIEALKMTTSERIKFLDMKIAAIFIQRWFRKKICIRAEQLQARIDEIKNSPEISTEVRAAIKIQALWRGYIVRKKKPRRKSSAVAIKKQNNPNLDPKVTLGERYKKAILQMKTSDMYDVITHALWNLESVTTLSAKLCEGVVAEGIIPIIFDIMARGNRSEPSLEIYRAGCSILVNLARYRPTKITLWENMNKVDDFYQILHIMKITHDKLQVPVFRYASTLLWLLCQDASAAQLVADLYSFRQQIEKMLETLKRKSMRNPQLRQNLKKLPKIDADWYPEPENKIFDNNYVAILNVHRILFNR